MANAPAGAHVGRNFSSDTAVGWNFSSGIAALAAALVLYLGLTAILLWLSLARTGGEFVYAQDDPYIHLAMARTLAEHGVWGVRPYEFASASSSPLWTATLAGLWRLGVTTVWVPFALNALFGCTLLVILWSWLSRVSHWAEPASAALAVSPAVLLSTIVVVTPLPTLALVGMEHTLQVLLTVTFVWQCSTRLSTEREAWLWPSAVAAAMVATRYESLFLIAAVSGLLLWQRRWRAALSLAVCASLPVLAFAWYSVSNGGLVLPNSVLMKSVPSRFATVSSGLSAVLSDWVAVGALFRRPPQLVLTVGVLLCAMLVPAARLTRPQPALWVAGVFLGTSVLHACLVKIEWFYRYEAYLITLGLVAMAGLIPLAEWPRGPARRRRQPMHPAVIPLLVLLGIPLGVRALGALAVTPGAVQNVYEQQVQLGRFIATHYAGRPVAVNDLGAVAWLSSSPILDVVGLATQEVADLKRHGTLDAAALERLASTRDIELVAVYESVFAPILPPGWVKVGEWTIANNVGVSGDTVAFFAPDADKAAALLRALDSFSRQLPRGVLWAPRTGRVPPNFSG
jgi:hypothetical protein